MRFQRMSWVSLFLVLLHSWPMGCASAAELIEDSPALEKQWPKWDGSETIERYAQRTGLKAADSLHLGDGVRLELVLVPAGDFEMGRDTGTAPEEKPVHLVTISRPFYMARYETTQEQYKQVTGRDPSSFRNSMNPVENVSWDDAQEFCKKLGETAGRKLLLPTEAQWEYACRAGIRTDDEGIVWDIGWHDNSGRRPHRVGEKRSNSWGIHDMYGNVGEWCLDWYDDKYFGVSPTVDPQGPAFGSDKVLRGGAWGQHVSSCLPAARTSLHPITRYYFYGFRVIAAIPE